jgi:1-acyl-sn-glycerol-3-phosphate acyltransferase
MQLRWRIGYWILYPIARFGLGLRIEGRQNVPRTGALIVASNHLSNIDPPLIGVGVGVRELHYLARHDLFEGMKFFGWLIRQLNAIPLKKGRVSIEAFRGVIDILGRDQAVVIFPEGTRSKTGSMLEPQIGLGYLAFKSGARILPAYLLGTDARVMDLVLRRRPFLVRFAKPLDPMKIAGDVDRRERYRRISEEVMNSIRALAGE